MFSHKLCEKWEKDIVPIPNKTVYINKWLARATLDILGAGACVARSVHPSHRPHMLSLAAFDYDYGAIDETDLRCPEEGLEVFGFAGGSGGSDFGHPEKGVEKG